MKDLKMYINGKFVESRSGEWIEVLNPSTEEVTSRQPAGTVEDVQEAVDAAYEAQKKWAKVPAAERAGGLRFPLPSVPSICTRLPMASVPISTSSRKSLFVSRVRHRLWLVSR